MQAMAHRLLRKHIARTQSGLTLVELMVALALSGVVALAAIASLAVTRRGFMSVDSSSQLRDNGRFAMEMLQRIAIQSAYADPAIATTPVAAASISGLDNSLPKILSTTTGANLSPGDFLSRTNPPPGVAVSKCTSINDTACNNGSDVLVVRFDTTTDGTMVDCTGNQQKAGDRITNIFFVAVSAGSVEPSLMCSYYSAASGSWYTQPLVEGVEVFQVLYGMDNNGDSVPDQFQNATSLGAWSGAVWKNVRALRIGLVLRGVANSAASRGMSLGTICALGYTSPETTIPQTLNGPATPAPRDCVDPPAAGDSAASSTGAEFPRKDLVLADDGRLRQTLTFTVNLRNAQ